MRRPSLTLLAWSATLHACPQLRDADFRALPGEVRSRPDAGGGAGGSDTIGGAGGNGHVTEPPRDASAPGVSVETLRAAIAHRYTFDGTGSIAVDSIGDSDATLIGATNWTAAI